MSGKMYGVRLAVVEAEYASHPDTARMTKMGERDRIVEAIVFASTAKAAVGKVAFWYETYVKRSRYYNRIVHWTVMDVRALTDVQLISEKYIWRKSQEV